MPIRLKLSKPKREWRYLIPEAEIKRYEKAGFYVSHRKPHDRVVVVKKKPVWEHFEEEVLILFKQGFRLNDVNGGPAFRVAGYQIDVVGGIASVLFVVECKTKQELGKKSLRSAIRSFWVKRREISSSLRRLFEGRYSRTKFVLALRGITPSDRDLAYAKKKNITVWPESYFDSLRNLYLRIGERARYYALRELGETPPLVPGGKGRYLEFPALEAKVGPTSYLYSSFVPARILLDLAYVLRVESGRPRAYQRYLDKSRLLKIAKFIEDKGSFKNSIVLALDKRTQFSDRATRLRTTPRSNSRVGILRVPRQYASAWVIDGQHRLYGYARVDEKEQNAMLPVVGLHTKNKTEEARTFLEINKNQKPVDPNLLWALFGTLYPHETRGLISDFVRLMASDRSSSLSNRIFVPGESKHSRKHYRVFHSNLCETIEDHLVSGKAKGYPLLPSEEIKEPRRTDVMRDALRIINSYLVWLARQAERAGQKRWVRDFFMTNNGLNVAVRVLVHILKHTNGKSDRKTLDNLFSKAMCEYLRENKENVDHLRRQTSSEGTRDFAAFGFVRALAREVKDFAQTYMKEHQQGREEQEPYRLMREAEGILRGLIYDRLSRLDPGWWKHRVPGDIREGANLRKEQDETPWPWMEGKNYPAYYYMNFADYSKVVCRGDNWKEAFKEIFEDPEWVRVVFKELEKIRNGIAHNRDLTSREVTVLKLYADDFRRAVEGASMRTPVPTEPPISATASLA